MLICVYTTRVDSIHLAALLFNFASILEPSLSMVHAKLVFYFSSNVLRSETCIMRVFDFETVGGGSGWGCLVA